MTPLSRRRAQALVEAAVVLPLLMLLALGAVGTGRLIQARMQLDAVAREAARAAALAPMPSVRGGDNAEQNARQIGRDEGVRVAQGYHMDDPEPRIAIRFQPGFSPGSWVNAEATRTIDVLPLLIGHRLFGGGGGPTIDLRTQQWERIDRFRSRSP